MGHQPRAELAIVELAEPALVEQNPAILDEPVQATHSSEIGRDAKQVGRALGEQARDERPVKRTKSRTGERARFAGFRPAALVQLDEFIQDVLGVLGCVGPLGLDIAEAAKSTAYAGSGALTKRCDDVAA
jgi:hypothetical protein